jgi:hypothetical protein
MLLLFALDSSLEFTCHSTHSDTYHPHNDNKIEAASGWWLWGGMKVQDAGPPTIEALLSTHLSVIFPSSSSSAAAASAAVRALPSGAHRVV